MNFFTVGFFLASLQLDLGWWIGYAIKLAGALFMLGGIAELSYLDKRAGSFRLPGVIFLAVCAGSVAASLLTDAETSAGNVVSIICGVVTTVPAALFFRSLLALLKAEPSIADNAPEVGRLCPKYDRMLFVTAVVLTADIINRLTGGNAVAGSDQITVADVTGLIVYVSKMIFYVYLVVCTLGFNTLRISFNAAHSD